MVYATPLQFAERSGLGIRIVDENIGTGDATETDFDLDYGNVIAGSYVLSYAASGSNTFTALTETTHYTLDKESGKIVLTSAGVTLLSTNILYGTYWYIEDFSSDVVEDFITLSDSEVDKLTGRSWSTSSSKTEYKDGRRSLQYPTTDQPYQPDWDQPDFIMLSYYPIVKIDRIFFLNSPMPIAKFFNYDLGTTTYTDKTDEINSTSETPFNLFDSSPAAGDIIYIGSDYAFIGLLTNLSTDGAGGTPAIDWEYYNGSAWTDITETEIDSGSAVFTASGKFTWSYPYGWSKVAVNGYTHYWIRGKLSTAWTTTAPIVSTITLVDNIGTILEPRNIIYKSATGMLNFMGVNVPNGQQNIRIDYYYGISSVPSYITELTILLAGVNAYIAKSGSSYDDATGVTLPEFSVQIGEVYVNIREVIDQFKKRINEILDMIGRRGDVIGL